MKHVQVYFSHANTGFCTNYYRTVPHKQLVCTIEQTKGVFEWHTATDDRTWEEPIGPINMNKYHIDIISEKEAKQLIREYNNGFKSK
jgi:hypothetical protein